MSTTAVMLAVRLQDGSAAITRLHTHAPIRLSEQHVQCVVRRQATAVGAGPAYDVVVDMVLYYYRSTKKHEAMIP